MYVNKTEIYKIKAKIEQKLEYFCLGRILKDFTKDEQKETSLNGIVYDFSVSHGSIKKEYILNIHQYLLIKKIYKIMCGLIKKYLFNC